MIWIMVCSTQKVERVWIELFEQLFSNPQVTLNPQQLSIYEILVLSNQTLILAIRGMPE